MQSRSKQKNTAGFVLLFAVTIAGILLAVALGVASIAEKEIRFGSSAKDTGSAFFAADTGIECALKYDKSSSSALNAFTGNAVMTCAGQPVTVTPSGSPASFWSFAVSGLSGSSCALVTVDKTSPSMTTVISKGYNTGDASCNGAGSRLERELHVSYSSGSPLTNFARASNGGTATASSTYSSNYPVDGAINGDRKGNLWALGGGWNDATAGAYPDWFQVDFFGSETISEIDVYTLQNNFSIGGEPTASTPADLYGIKDFQVQYDNGSGWQTVTGGTVTGNTMAWRRFAFSAIANVTKIRINITNAALSHSRLVEVEAWGSN